MRLGCLISLNRLKECLPNFTYNFIGVSYFHSYFSLVRTFKSLPLSTYYKDKIVGTFILLIRKPKVNDMFN